MTLSVRTRFVALLVGAVVSLGCSQRSVGVDTNTSWLRECNASSDCDGELPCTCGVCTRACDRDVECDGLGEGALCGGAEHCSESLCVSELSSVGGVDDVASGCPADTWDHDADPDTSCEPRRTCADDEWVSVAANARRDRQCEPCPEGTVSEGPNATACHAPPSRFKSVSVGVRHVCGIRVDGQPECWGYDDGGVASPPADLSLSTVTAGTPRSCGLGEDDAQLRCWGTTIVAGDELAEPTDEALTMISASRAGGGLSCAIREADGEALCWASAALPNAERYAPPSGVAFTMLDVGTTSACGVRASDGLAQCWGVGLAEVLPRQVEVYSLSVAERHACAVRDTDGRVECWYDDSSSEPGVEASTRAPDDVGFREVSAGPEHTCGIREADGRLECWGGDGALDAPVDVAFSGISVGSAATCGVVAGVGRVRCWGGTDGDLLGLLPPSGARQEKLAVGRNVACALREADRRAECWLGHAAPAFALTDICAGRDFACGIRAVDGFAECWGDNVDEVLPPVSVRLASITCGLDFACGLRREDGEVVCWGQGDVAEELPQAVAFDRISAGSYHVCGIRSSDERAQCWGGDASGQASPPANGRFSEIVGGDVFTCAVRVDGRVECWGAASEPPQRDGLSALSAGGPHVCAIRDEDGRVVCWSDDPDDELALAPNGEFVRVASSDNYACALRADDGTEVCWGTLARKLWR